MTARKAEKRFFSLLVCLGEVIIKKNEEIISSHKFSLMPFWFCLKSGEKEIGRKSLVIMMMILDGGIEFILLKDWITLIFLFNYVIWSQSVCKPLSSFGFNVESRFLVTPLWLKLEFREMMVFSRLVFEQIVALFSQKKKKKG